MKSRFIRFAAAVAVTALVASPSFAAARGSANFSRFYAIGDSYGAGFASGALEINHQQYGWPTIIARQVGLTICPPTAAASDNCFAVPYISFPGLGSSNELQLLDVTKYPPVIAPAPGQAQPLMLGFARPYNNLAVPGYTVGAAQVLTGKEANSGLGQVILRGLGSEVDQALSQHPTFIAVWLGGNDFLGSVTAGTTTGLTSTAAFTAQYNALLDKLVAGAPNAGMVVGTLPTNPAAVPFLNTVAPVVIDPSTRQPVLVGGNPIRYVYTDASGAVATLPQGSFVLLSAAAKLASGYGIPAPFKAVPPFSQLPNTGTPLSDADVITPDEIATIVARIAEYNNVITTAASARNIPVADIKGLFDRIASRKTFAGPFPITGDFITGGFFSLDGIHLTDIGYTMFANEYIKAINAGYNTRIPLASYAAFLQNNGVGAKGTSGTVFLSGMQWELSEEGAAALYAMFTDVQVPQPASDAPPTHRLRVSHH